MYIELIQWTHSVALINHLLSNPTGIPFLYNNSVFQDAVTQPMVASVVNPATTPTALSNDSVSHGAVTQLLLNHLQRLLPYPTNILLENHGTSISVVTDLTVTLRVFALMRRLFNVTLATPLPFF